MIQLLLLAVLLLNFVAFLCVPLLFKKPLLPVRKWDGAIEKYFAGGSYYAPHRQIIADKYIWRMDESPLTFENITTLGFVYNYFDGYIYQNDDGFSISVYDVNTINFRGQSYRCLTVGDFIALKNKLVNGEKKESSAI